MAAAAILEFRNCEILLAIGVERVETQQHAEFRQHRSINCEYIMIFRFFKMAAILNCQIRQMLLADSVRRAHTHHCNKFHQNRSFAEILQFFKMAAAAILDF